MINILISALVAAVEQELVKCAPAVQQVIASQLQYLAESAYKYMNQPKEAGENKK